jgi:hypothetical protein
MIMTDRSVQANGTTALSDAELDAVAGGEPRAETQLFQALANAVSNVIKSMGEGLQNAARAG